MVCLCYGPRMAAEATVSVTTVTPGCRDRRDRRERANGEDGLDPAAVRVKQEPVDDYPEYPNLPANPALKDEDKKPRQLREQPASGAGDSNPAAGQDDGEIDY